MKTFKERFPMFMFYTSTGIFFLTSFAAILSVFLAASPAINNEWDKATFFAVCFFGFSLITKEKFN